MGGEPRLHGKTDTSHAAYAAVVARLDFDRWMRRYRPYLTAVTHARQCRRAAVFLGRQGRWSSTLPTRRGPQLRLNVPSGKLEILGAAGRWVGPAEAVPRLPADPGPQGLSAVRRRRSARGWRARRAGTIFAWKWRPFDGRAINERGFGPDERLARARAGARIVHRGWTRCGAGVRPAHGGVDGVAGGGGGGPPQGPQRREGLCRERNLGRRRAAALRGRDPEPASHRRVRPEDPLPRRADPGRDRPCPTAPRRRRACRGQRCEDPRPFRDPQSLELPRASRPAHRLDFEPLWRERACWPGTSM